MAQGREASTAAGSLSSVGQYFDNFTPVSGTITTPGTSVIDVSGMPPVIEHVDVYLHGVNSSAPMSDVWMQVQAPNGDVITLIEGACLAATARVQDMEFGVGDTAPAPLPKFALDANDLCWTAHPTIQPTSYFSQGEPLSVLNGGPANGAWRVIVHSEDNRLVGLLRGFGIGLTAGYLTTATPDVTAASPAGPSRSTTPAVRGTADAGSTVSLYDNSVCAGTPLGTGSAAAFNGAGIVATVPADTMTTIFAAATRAGQNDSACSTTFVHYVNDSTPPDTTYTRVPHNSTRHRARLEFRSTEAVSSFRCKLDAGTYHRCVSPVRLRGLEVGRHVFRVKAIDAAGNADPTPAVRAWRVKRAA